MVPVSLIFVADVSIATRILGYLSNNILCYNMFNFYVIISYLVICYFKPVINHSAVKFEQNPAIFSESLIHFLLKYGPIFRFGPDQSDRSGVMIRNGCRTRCFI